MYLCPYHIDGQILSAETDLQGLFTVRILRLLFPFALPQSPATKKAKMATTSGNGGGSPDHGGAEGSKQCIKTMVDQGSMESHRFYLSRKTVLEMLKDRGYNVDDSELMRPLAEFRFLFGDNPDLERLRISASLRSNPSKKVNFI